jgi:hypothetical protein
MANSFLSLPTELQHEYFPLLASWFVERYPQELKHLAGYACRPSC